MARDPVIQSNTILVVDDEALLREMLVELLTSEGYNVVPVATGGETFDHLEKVDLVLLDCVLPDDNGWDICRRIKTTIDPLLPVLMLTGRTSPEDVVRAFDAGADDYITKPFNSRELTARIDTRLRHRHTELALKEAYDRFQQLAEQNYQLYEQAQRDADERAALLREIDHRVRNNLSVILGLVSMERNRRPERSTSRALGSLESRMRAFLLVHDTFRAEGYQAIPICALIERLVQRVASTLDPQRFISIGIDCDPFELGERQAFALALVLNELLANSYGHAFPDGASGRIEIRCVCKDAAVDLVVDDDGSGFEDSVEPPALGSGRSIAETLTRGELGGTIDFDGARDGTRVTVRFPVAGATVERDGLESAEATDEA